MPTSDDYFYQDPNPREWSEFLEKAEPPEWLKPDPEPDPDLEGIDLDEFDA